MARKCSAQRAQQAAGGFAAAKKNVVIQFQGIERQQEELMELVRQDIMERGITDAELEKVDVYIKPEERAVYYVVNDRINGKISF